MQFGYIPCMHVLVITQPTQTMKTFKCPGIPWVLFFFVLAILPCPGELREWTSSKGTKLTAKLVSKTDTELTLKNKSGKEITLAIKQLSEADQQYLKELEDGDKPEVAAAGNKRKAGKKAGLLPVLSDGFGAGYFAYYDGDHYVARINSNATMDVYLKDKEQSSGLLDSWKMVIEPIAYKKNRFGSVSGHRMVEIIKNGDPVEDPDKVELSVILDLGIRCDLIYEFSDEGITTWMKSEHGSDPPEVMSHMMTHRMGSVRNLAKNPQDLEEMRLKIESDKYDYAGKYRIKPTVSKDDYEISMPALTSTKIRFDKGPDKGVRLLPWKYADDPLAKGYYIRARKAEYNSNNHKREKTSINFHGK